MNELTESKEKTGKNEILKGISKIIKNERREESKKNSLKQGNLCNLFSFLLSCGFLLFVFISCGNEDIYTALMALAGFIAFFLMWMVGSLIVLMDKSNRKTEKKIRKLLKEARP